MQATISVDADIPFPLNSLPNSAMEAAGNAAFSTTIYAMLEVGPTHLQHPLHVTQTPPPPRLPAPCIHVRPHAYLLQGGCHTLRAHMQGYMANLRADYDEWCSSRVAAAKPQQELKQPQQQQVAK